MKVLVVVLVFSFANFAFAKGMSSKQQECLKELSEYGNVKGKQALADATLIKTCKKHADSKFLSCVKLAERPLAGVKLALAFCSKNSDHSTRLTCLQDLSAYKNKDGKQELTGEKLANVCSRGSTENFLSCVGKVQRPLGKAANAVEFCKKTPSVQAQKCVSELGSYAGSGGGAALSPKVVLATCKKENSEKFLACVSSTQRSLDGIKASVNSCSKISLSKRLPASLKKKKNKKKRS